MKLYCKLPFGQFDQSNKVVQDVAAKMGRTPGSLAMKLSNLASLDTYHQDRGVVGLKGASNLDRKVWADFQANWTAMADQSEAAFENLMRSDSLPPLPAVAPLPTGPSEVERTVKARRLQRFFRDSVLASYEFKCAVSGVAVPELLIASHIIPWHKDEARRADPTNGLCLNALYDCAFDRGLITFDEDFRMVVAATLKKDRSPEFQQINFLKVEGSKLILPHRFHPDAAALQHHRENIFVA